MKGYTIIPVGSRVFDPKSTSPYDYIIVLTKSQFKSFRLKYNTFSIKSIESPTLLPTFLLKGIANKETCIDQNNIGIELNIYCILRPRNISFYNLKIQNLYLSALIDINTVSPKVIERYHSIIERAKSVNRYGNGFPTGMGYLYYTKNTMDLDIPLSDALQYFDRKHLYHHMDYGYLYIYNCDMNNFN